MKPNPPQEAPTESGLKKTTDQIIKRLLHISSPPNADEQVFNLLKDVRDTKLYKTSYDQKNKGFISFGEFIKFLKKLLFKRLRAVASPEQLHNGYKLINECVLFMELQIDDPSIKPQRRLVLQALLRCPPERRLEFWKKGKDVLNQNEKTKGQYPDARLIRKIARENKIEVPAETLSASSIVALLRKIRPNIRVESSQNMTTKEKEEHELFDRLLSTESGPVRVDSLPERYRPGERHMDGVPTKENENKHDLQAGQSADSESHSEEPGIKESNPSEAASDETLCEKASQSNPDLETAREVYTIEWYSTGRNLCLDFKTHDNYLGATMNIDVKAMGFDEYDRNANLAIAHCNCEEDRAKILADMNAKCVAYNYRLVEKRTLRATAE